VESGDNEALQILKPGPKGQGGKGKGYSGSHGVPLQGSPGTGPFAMKEIRGQLNLQLDIFKTLYDVEAVQSSSEKFWRP